MSKTAVLLDFDDTVFNTAQFKIIREQYALEEIAERLTYKDALEFLEQIDYKNFTPMILTFSVNPEYQHAKINSSGIAKHNLPVIITDVENKTELLASWFNDGGYEIPNQGRFSEIVFVDDRPKHLVGFEELTGARGFLMQRNTLDLTNKLPKNVSVVRDFSEIML